MDRKPLKLWTTIIVARDPADEKLTLWMGPNVPGRTLDEARAYCQEYGLGYCRVDGEYICEIDEKDITVEELEAAGIKEDNIMTAEERYTKSWE